MKAEDSKGCPEKNYKTELKGVLMLFITALIWGTSFVSQSVGMESVKAFTFMGIRTLLGSFFLVPFILIKDYKQKKRIFQECKNNPGNGNGNFDESAAEEKLSLMKKRSGKSYKTGALIGLALCGASNFQQFAFYYSTPGKIAFITAMYMFFVPVASLIFFKKKISISVWICIAFGFVGLYFLCLGGKAVTEIGKGDVLAFICSLLFVVQILLIEKYSPDCDALKLSSAQFFTCGSISFILMLIFEHPEMASILNAKNAILYSGILSCGVAYTFQVAGQKRCEATIASLIMCMESVFAVLSSAIILQERLTIYEIIGCTIMFLAIIISQLSQRQK